MSWQTPPLLQNRRFTEMKVPFFLLSDLNPYFFQKLSDEGFWYFTPCHAVADRMLSLIFDPDLCNPEPAYLLILPMKLKMQY